MTTFHRYAITKDFKVTIFAKNDWIPLVYSGKLETTFKEDVILTKKISFNFNGVINFLKGIGSSIKTNHSNIVKTILAQCDESFDGMINSKDKAVLDDIEFYVEVIDWNRSNRYTSESIYQKTTEDEEGISLDWINVNRPFYIEFLINAYNYLTLKGFWIFIFWISLISSIISLITSTIGLYSIGALHGVFMFSAIFLTFIVWETFLYHVFCSIIFSFAKTVLDRFNR